MHVNASNFGAYIAADVLANPAVIAIVIDPLASNVRTHKFYQRLGFAPEGRRMFGEDDCLVHRLTRTVWRQRFPQD